MRTYSEREVAAIIERAVERQHTAEVGGGDAGLTLDEIERLGRESGIDPAHLRAAASEIDAAGRTLARQNGQSKTQVYTERWIDAPFSSAGWEDAVAHLRAEFGAPIGAAFGSTAGETVQQVGRAYEWLHTSGMGIRTRVTASPRGDRTRLHLTQFVGISSSAVEGVGCGAVIAIFVAVVGGVTGAGISGSPAVALVTALITFLVAWAVGALIIVTADRRWRAKKLRQLDALADDLAPVFRTPSQQAAAADLPEAEVDVPEADAPAARLDLDALADDAPAEEPRQRPTQRVR